MNTIARWGVHVGIPAAFAAGSFIAAEAYEPSENRMAYVHDRQDEEPLIIDAPVIIMNLSGGLFTIQAINHATMIIWPTRNSRQSENT